MKRTDLESRLARVSLNSSLDGDGVRSEVVCPVRKTRLKHGIFLTWRKELMIMMMKGKEEPS